MVGLDDDPFEYRITKSGKVLVSRDSRQVATIGGERAARLIDQLGGSQEADQQLLARVTGNYRRGNERRSRR